MDSRVSKPKPRQSRLARVAEIAGIVAASVAVVTLVLEHNPVGGHGRGPTVTPTTLAGPTTPPAPAPDGGGTPTATRFLTELQPHSGGANVQRVGAHSLTMACGSGNDTDASRTVTYLLPPAAAYRSFRTVLSAAGQRDTRIQAILTIDDRVAAQPVVTAGSTVPLAWQGDSAAKLTLRIRCDPYATTATFTDPALSG